MTGMPCNLCAQAIALEEMLQVTINVGFLFYGQTKHRQEIQMDAALRKQYGGTGYPHASTRTRGKNA